MNDRVFPDYCPTDKALKNIKGDIIDKIYKSLPNLHYQDCGLLYEFCLRRNAIKKPITTKYIKYLFNELLNNQEKYF